MQDKQYRVGLPEMPPQIRRLPIERGYPVPWFVSKVDGHYDFRLADYRRKLPLAIKKKLCWICGCAVGKEYVFPIGPMCAVNRTTAEPPSHMSCAEFAALACPFLLQKEQERRSSGLPPGAVLPAGHMIERQPGVILLWRTDSYSLFSDGMGGRLFHIGPPISTRWLREGREATRAEIEESIQSGLPALKEKCHTFQDFAALKQAVEVAMQLLPAEAVSA